MTQQASKKDTVLDLNKYLDKAVRVRFQGGREGASRIFRRNMGRSDHCMDGWMGVCVCAYGGWRAPLVGVARCVLCGDACDDMIDLMARSTHACVHISKLTVSGILKGFDQLINLVLDEGKETVRGAW